MPPREWDFRVRDILESIAKIQRYTDGLDLKRFRDHEMALDAVIRNLEVIGEAAHQVPDEIKASAPDLPWKEMRAMRNLLAHEYFGADPKTVWETARHDLPPLIPRLRALIENLG